jgi:uncharacterized repeat protein (TIGR03803 family)
MKNFPAPAACLAWATAAFLTLGLASASAARLVYIHDFTGGADGALPDSTLTPDGAGNVYGTTQYGGDQPESHGGDGTIFRIDRSGQFTTIYTFQNGDDGGNTESGVSFIRGRLYGSAPGGPNGDASSLFSLNTDGSDFTVLGGLALNQGGVLVGQLQPAKYGMFGLGNFITYSGEGTLFYVNEHNVVSVVHRFLGGSDGRAPSYLIEDGKGTLFGSTFSGGGCTNTKNATEYGCGTIFEYVPASGAYTVLYRFQNEADGFWPLLGAVGPDGTLYGVTTGGNVNKQGALFQLKPTGGVYAFSVLSPIKSRIRNDKAINPPALSANGTLVGATYYGATYTWQNGQYAVFYPSTPAGQVAGVHPLGQYLTSARQPDTILGTSYYGGQTSGPCGTPGGCGFVYYGVTK